MRPRAWLFDYGGTLDGEGWHWFDRFLHLYRAAGSTLPAERIHEAFYAADAVLYEEVPRRRFGHRAMMERHLAVQMAHLGEPFEPLGRRLVEDFQATVEAGWAAARPVLASLRKDARIGVVSNFYGNLGAVLEEAGLDALVDEVVESARVGFEKPDPAIYRLAAERLGIEPRDAVMVGDNFDRDVRPAKSIGMSTVWLRRGTRALPEGGVADRIVAGLRELVA